MVDFRLKNVSVVGLGKLGAPLAALLAQRSYTVVGLDQNPSVIDSVNKGESPIVETGLQEIFKDNRSRLRATSSYDEAVRLTDATFVVVPTPSDASGSFSNDYVLSAIESIARALVAKNSYHLVILTSTVMPGSTGGIVKETLERISSKTVGVDVGLCYNPEFIALGSVIRDMENPDMVLIGESDSRAGDLLESIQLNICLNQPCIHRMDFVNAEIAKISVNTYVTTKISFANMLAGICQNIPGADVDVVTGAIGEDSRIGAKYLKGGLGYGGPCFPRDNIAFAKMADRIGAPAYLAEATDQINEYQIDRIVDLVRRHAKQDDVIGILGFSYKPGTPVVEQSHSVKIAQRLIETGSRIAGYDPLAIRSARAELNGSFSVSLSLSDCLEQSDLIVIATPWSEIQDIDWAAVGQAKKTGDLVVIDCWRVISRKSIQRSGIRLVHPGVGSNGNGASAMA